MYICAIVHDILMKTCTKLLELCSFESLLADGVFVSVHTTFFPNVDKIQQKWIIKRFHIAVGCFCCLNWTYLSHVKLLTLFSVLLCVCVFSIKILSYIHWSTSTQILKNNHSGNVFILHDDKENIKSFFYFTCICFLFFKTLFFIRPIYCDCIKEIKIFT